jgi:hypothetical protein
MPPDRLAVLDEADLALVAGGEGWRVVDRRIEDSWGFAFASDSCRQAVQDAGKITDLSQFSAAGAAVDAAWNGPPCAYYGYGW